MSLLPAAAPVAVAAAALGAVTSALTPLDPLGAKRLRLWSFSGGLAASAAGDSNQLVVQRIQLSVRPMVNGVVASPNAILAIDNSYVGSYLSNGFTTLACMQIPWRDFLLSDWRQIVGGITGFAFEIRGLVRNTDAVNPHSVVQNGGTVTFELFPD